MPRFFKMFLNFLTKCSYAWIRHFPFGMVSVDMSLLKNEVGFFQLTGTIYLGEMFGIDQF